MINLVSWDKHSSFVGTVGLLICIFGGIMYQQSTRDKPKAIEAERTQEGEDEERKLLEMQSVGKSNDDEKKAFASG